MTRMTGPDSAVMCNLINTHTHTHTHTHTLEGFNDWGGRGYDDFVPAEVTKIAPFRDETT